jgi:hypothetical protein
MSDSNAREDGPVPQARNREQRIEDIKRWVEYIRTHSPETWGPQQNAIVDGQLEAAQGGDFSVSHQQQVTAVADEILNVSDSAGDESA